jgi:adenylate cyclase
MALEIIQDFRGPVLQMGDLRIPMDEHAQVLLRTARTLDTIPVIRSVDVLAGNMDPKTISGRIVLVGSSASGLGDLHHTATLSNLPARPPMPSCCKTFSLDRITVSWSGSGPMH